MDNNFLYDSTSIIDGQISIFDLMEVKEVKNGSYEEYDNIIA